MIEKDRIVGERKGENGKRKAERGRRKGGMEKGGRYNWQIVKV